MGRSEKLLSIINGLNINPCIYRDVVYVVLQEQKMARDNYLLIVIIHNPSLIPL